VMTSSHMEELIPRGHKREIFIKKGKGDRVGKERRHQKKKEKTKKEGGSQGKRGGKIINLSRNEKKFIRTRKN